MKAEFACLRRDCEFRRIPPALRGSLGNRCGARSWSTGGPLRADLLFTLGNASAPTVVTFALLLPVTRRGLPLPHRRRGRSGGLSAERFQPVSDFLEYGECHKRTRFLD
jgi:hypothetical protein